MRKMKKILTVVVLFAALMTAVPAKAEVKFGLKGGLNLTSMSLDANAFSKSNQAGFFIGPTVKFTIPIVGLGFDASALYDQRSAEVGNEKIKQQSIQIPINIRYGFGLGSTASIYFFAGPQFGFNVGDKSFTSFDKATATASTWTLKSSNLSANVGLGLMLLGHLQVSANYNFALGKTGEYQSIQGASSMLFEGDTKMNAWQIGLTYFF
jgi:opacity protein-like surface antigen